MEEGLNIIEKKKSLIDILVTVINVMAVIVSFILLILGRIKAGIFIGASILVVNNACVKPFIKYIREAASGKNEKLFSGAVILGLRTSYVTGVLYTLNKLIFTYPIVEDKLYWFYNLMLILLILLVIIDLIKKFFDKIIKLKDEGASLKKFIGGFLLIILTSTFSLIIPAVEQFQPKKEINLNNIKRPIGFEIIDYTNYVQGSSVIYKHNSKDIWDKELAEDLYKEISKLQPQNIRNLDMLNYKIKYINNKSYYAILPLYEETRGIHIDGIDNGYIYEIKLHLSGEVILVNLNTNPTHFTRQFDIYRLNLSKNFIDEIFKKIE